MKFREFVDNMNTLLKENSEIADYVTIYATNDEGNLFQEIDFTPTIGYIGDKGFEDDEEMFKKQFNSVCVN